MVGRGRRLVGSDMENYARNDPKVLELRRFELLVERM
jgi:hypothetical protein